MSALPKTCLVVDDEGSLREALRKVLERQGFQCKTAASGAEALAMLERELVPLVISDIRMPEMDGMALLQQIRERWPDVGVVLVTGVTEAGVAVSCLQMGALDYITKPFQIDEVGARAEQALDRRRLILENRRYQEHLSDLVQQQAQRIEELFLEGVQTLVEALEAKDAYTRGHSSRVSEYSGTIARALGMSRTDVQLLELGAELHDVGKIGVRESVLLKPGALDKQEYAHLMEHTVIGARILSPLLGNTPEVLQVVRSHHERLDGRGLPDGLRGEAIPLHARVVSVADAFDAMTSARPYRPAMTADVAVVELDACAGQQFDPDVIRAFRDAYADLKTLPIATPPKVLRRLPLGLAAGDVAAS